MLSALLAYSYMYQWLGGPKLLQLSSSLTLTVFSFNYEHVTSYQKQMTLKRVTCNSFSF